MKQRKLTWVYEMNEVANDARGRVSEDVTAAIREVVMIARHLVNNPEEVQVDIECKGYTVLVALRTNKRDVGQVIGRNAHLMNSIRSFLAAIGGKNNVQIVLDYVTEEDNRREKTYGMDRRSNINR